MTIQGHPNKRLAPRSMQELLAQQTPVGGGVPPFRDTSINAHFVEKEQQVRTGTSRLIPRTPGEHGQEGSPSRIWIHPKSKNKHPLSRSHSLCVPGELSPRCPTEWEEMVMKASPLATGIWKLGENGQVGKG